MVEIERVETRAQVRRFVGLPYRLYAGHKQWVPPLWEDAALPLDRQKHPFYEHSEAEFFLARREGRDVGRIAALENRHYNAYHGKKRAQFYCFECEDDAEAAGALFARALEWAQARGLTEMVGPKGFGALTTWGCSWRAFAAFAIAVLRASVSIFPVSAWKTTGLLPFCWGGNLAARRSVARWLSVPGRVRSLVVSAPMRATRRTISTITATQPMTTGRG